MTLTPDDLQKLRAALEASRAFVQRQHDCIEDDGGYWSDFHSEAEAELVMAAVNALPELLRLYEAVLGAPVVLATEWMWENVPEELEGQSVRLVPVTGG